MTEDYLLKMVPTTICKSSPYSLCPASSKPDMFTSDFDYLRTFGEDGLGLPQRSLYETPDYQNAEQLLDQSFFKLHEQMDPVDFLGAPNLMEDQLSDSFGLAQSQIPVALPQTPCVAGNEGFLLDSFQLAPMSPQIGEEMYAFPNIPSSPFGMSFGGSDTSGESDSDGYSFPPLNQSTENKDFQGPSGTADRSYFKVDLDFPWPVYIKDPERLSKVMRWKQKKISVLQEHKSKKNTYQVRTDVANRRMRVKGRFVGKCIS
eukprot:TRINITY_DN3016_c0_g1_i1.p1 TRINITY_DN3016_c0_g1~~TRINITY_DN3016_c0_g1_i1.p1  ORF type:complete len:260 (-),score=61.98 TRINITY_DN3016_c0_g1_i1:49-828(-)